MSVAAQPSEPRSPVDPRDLLQLAKPRITALVVFTTASGLWLAPGNVPASLALLTMLGTVLIVAAANALNMYLERDSDAFMPRTALRPLPAGRMAPVVALKFGLGLAAVSVPLIAATLLDANARGELLTQRGLGTAKLVALDAIPRPNLGDYMSSASLAIASVALVCAEFHVS